MEQEDKKAYWRFTIRYNFLLLGCLYFLLLDTPGRRCKHVCFGMRLRGCLPAEATLVRLRRYGGCAWGKVDCERVKDCYFYSRLNFKLNRAAALARWRQLLSA